jgi:hypothetical protein
VSKKRHKTKPGYGSKKGSAFERKIAGQLSTWLFKDPHLLWRVGGSGGRATTQKHVPLYGGDIVPLVTKYGTTPVGFPYFIECKFYRKIALEDLLSSKEGLIEKWWKKAKSQSTDQQNIVLLVIKQNHKPALVVIPMSYYAILNNGVPKLVKAKRFNMPSMKVVILELDSLFKFKTPFMS